MKSNSNDKSVREILGRDTVHPFPARMAPGLALDVVSECRDPMRVLDPMAGSGTALAVAQNRGHFATGVDIDPLAVLISSVWTTPIDAKAIEDRAGVALARAKHKFKSLKTRNAYPKNSDDETQGFVRYWFDDNSRRQLASLAMAIEEVQDCAARDVLWCAFSRLIITKRAGASLAMDLSHSRPHRVFKRAPSKPFCNFLLAVDRVTRNCLDIALSPIEHKASVLEGDARNLPFEAGSFDLVLTSPPYLNAIDYLRCSKFSLVWMGYSVREVRRLRSISVGTEVGMDVSDDDDIGAIISELNLQPSLEKRQKAILANYIEDMRRFVRETNRVLARRGQAVYVIGDNTVRGTFIRNSLIMKTVASSAGMRFVSQSCRELPGNRRYLPPPTVSPNPAALDGRIRREVILTFEKTA